jgi:prepilin-type processing-associated H-X9-DG protein
MNQTFVALHDRLDLDRGWKDPANSAILNTPLPVFRCPGDTNFEPHHRPGLTNYVGIAGIGPEAATLPKTNPRAGIFGYQRTVTGKDLHAGTSYTMLAAETAHDLGPWLAGGPSTVRSVPPTGNPPGPGFPFGGLHRGGLYVLWADGSVRWVADSVPPEDFRAQATLAGKAENRPPP